MSVETGHAPEARYDSSADTLRHIQRVSGLLHECVLELLYRGEEHDASKLREPELAIFDEYTPKLRHTTYGSDAYQQYLREMAPALQHHYAHNRHHPEHFADGVSGMTLIDLLEMLADWKAATERHSDGDLMRSLQLNQARFGISPQLQVILINTARDMRWVQPEDVAQRH